MNCYSKVADTRRNRLHARLGLVHDGLERDALVEADSPSVVAMPW